MRAHLATVLRAYGLTPDAIDRVCELANRLRGGGAEHVSEVGAPCDRPCPGVIIDGVVARCDTCGGHGSKGGHVPEIVDVRCGGGSE